MSARRNNDEDDNDDDNDDDKDDDDENDDESEGERMEAPCRLVKRYCCCQWLGLSCPQERAGLRPPAL